MPFQLFATKVQSTFGILSQPDAYTCQSTAIAQAIGTTDIRGIREKLTSRGEAGDPFNMGRLLREHLGDRYHFDDNACLSEAREALKRGCFCITHGYFSKSGHVISFDGVAIDNATLSYKFDVKDPYSEFDFKSWSYNNLSIDRYDGFYSSYGIYAACVKGQSYWDAAAVYRRGELDSMKKGMWLHVIEPAGVVA